MPYARRAVLIAMQEFGFIEPRVERSDSSITLVTPLS
jgi:hypothetical protein